MEGGRGRREREREREDAVDNLVKKGLFTCKYEHIYTCTYIKLENATTLGE